jgi:hypothetical protein
VSGPNADCVGASLLYLRRNAGSWLSTGTAFMFTSGAALRRRINWVDRSIDQMLSSSGAGNSIWHSRGPPYDEASPRGPLAVALAMCARAILNANADTKPSYGRIRAHTGAYGRRDFGWARFCERHAHRRRRNDFARTPVLASSRQFGVTNTRLVVAPTTRSGDR